MTPYAKRPPGGTAGRSNQAVSLEIDESNGTTDCKSIVDRLDQLAAEQAAQRVLLQVISRDVEHLGRCAHACATGDKLVHLVVPEGFRICAPCYRRANGAVTQ